jgi:hypothetical protein
LRRDAARKGGALDKGGGGHRVIKNPVKPTLAAAGVLRLDPDTGFLKFLLLPLAQIDQSYSADFGDASYAVARIWLARNGLPLRYRVWRTAPDNTVVQSAEADWVDAADVLHLVDGQFPGQMRGISPLAPTGRHGASTMVA